MSGLVIKSSANIHKLYTSDIHKKCEQEKGYQKHLIQLVNNPSHHGPHLQSSPFPPLSPSKPFPTESHILTTSFSKYGLKKGPQGKLFRVQLPLSTDLDLDLDLCRSTDDGDLDLLEEARFWLLLGRGDLLTDRDLLRLLLRDRL